MEHRQKPLPRIEQTNIGEGDKLIALHYFNNKCCYCGITLTREYGFPNSLEMEHFISINQQIMEDDELIINGTIDNRVPSCRTCNRQKSDTPPEIWIRSRFANANEILEKIYIYFSLQQEFSYE